MNKVAEGIFATSAFINIISFLIYLSEFKSFLNDRELELDNGDGEGILYTMMNVQKDSLPKLMNYISLSIFILIGAWMLASPLRPSKSWPGILILFLSLLVCNLNFHSSYWTLRDLRDKSREGKNVVPYIRRTFRCFMAFGYINAFVAGFGAFFQLHDWPSHTSRVVVVFLKTVLALGVLLCAVPIQFMLGAKNVTAGIVLGAIAICLIVPVYVYTRFFLAKDTTEAAAHSSDERVALIISSVPVTANVPQIIPVVGTVVPARPVVATAVPAYV